MDSGKKGWVPITASPWEGSQSQKTSLQGGEGKAAQINKAFQRHVAVPQKPVAIGQILPEEEKLSSLGLWSKNTKHHSCWDLSAASGFWKAAELMLDTNSSCGWELTQGKKTRCVLGGIPRQQHYLSRQKNVLGKAGDGGGRALYNSHHSLARDYFKHLMLIFKEGL